VVGHVNSHASIAAAPVYAEAGVPQISPVSNPRYTQLGLKTTFRIAANDDQQGAVLARFALETGAKSFVVADNGTAYGKGLADAFEATAKAHGGRVLGRVEATAPGFNGVMARIKALKPDLVLFGGIDAEAAALAKQMVATGIRTRLMGGDAVQTGNFIRLAGPAGAGVTASATGDPLEQSPNGQAFLRRYQQKFGTDTVLHAPHGYDAVMVIVSAMQRASSVDPARFLAEIRTTQRHGLTGNLAFDPQGDLKDAPVTLYAVSDGRWVAVQTVLASGGK
jgi:branched-chain amino acid transport system substrate-binding protein